MATILGQQQHCNATVRLSVSVYLSDVVCDGPHFSFSGVMPPLYESLQSWLGSLDVFIISSAYLCVCIARVKGDIFTV